jgi:hypothetical protein
MRLTRRNLFQLGGVSLLSGAGVPILAARAAKTNGTPRGKARACIILFQVGGPYQCDTFDPKPGAPEEMRGPFRPIATTVPGLRVTEALPQVAQQAERWSVIRSVHHLIRCHNPAIYCTLAGREATDVMAVSAQTNAKRTDHPHYASVLARLRPGVASMPRHVIIPDVVYNGPAKSPGQLAGYLGASYDPFVLGVEPSAPDFRVEGVGLPDDVVGDRFGGRKTLLQELDQRQRLVEATSSLDAMHISYREAFSLLT